MSVANLPMGSFSPGQIQSTFFAMYADDCELHFELSELTPKQRVDHAANITLTAMLQVALIYMGRKSDHVALHDTFQQAPWAEALAFYSKHFEALFGDVIPPTNYHYFPRDGFYAALANVQIATELLTLYMVSGSNYVLHNSDQAWQLSKKTNSKMHFATTAPQAGIPVPATQVMTKATLATEGEDFFRRHPSGVMLKIQGLAGSRNVTHCATLAEAEAYVAEFPDTLSVLLQQRLDTSRYTEMTVDLNVTNTRVEITNTRRILFADGLWVGNHLSPEVVLSETQKEICLRVGDYVRELGYASPQGFNCGIDFFIRAKTQDETQKDTQKDSADELIVIEINARWTGGLFPAQLIERLGIQQESCVAFIDTISSSALTDYLHFIDTHGLVDQRGTRRPLEGEFHIVPMGFSPFTQVVEGATRMYVWQVVVGDFAAFVRAKNQGLGETELATANLISV